MTTTPGDVAGDVVSAFHTSRSVGIVLLSHFLQLGMVNIIVQKPKCLRLTQLQAMND